MSFVKGSRERRSPALCIAITVTVWLVIQTSATKGFLQDQYVGCFKDSGQSTASNVDNTPDASLTIESCIAKCQTTYATIQSGNVCLCREDYGEQLPDTTCNLTCSGNNNEFCSGQLNAYVVYTGCPIGTYDAACDKGCHCKREVPCDRTTGNCPNGCLGNWSGSACDTTKVSQQYIGCYGDDPRNDPNNRALEGCVYCNDKDANNKNNTLEFCSQSCAERNYTYAGTEYSWLCFCGDNYDRHGTSNNCNMKCSGNSSEICGGVDALSVYSVCPAGNYGRSCLGRCHCANDNRCIYRNGACPLQQCKAGWRGTSCNIRDCSQINGGCYTNETCSYITLKYSTISMCRCSDGFRRNKTWENCTDTDECALLACDPVSTNCINTVGNYSCNCKSGFQRQNYTTCIDIDECQQNSSACDKTSTNCINTPGSYECKCKEGFKANNTTVCSDIDECSPLWSKCGSQAHNCTNTIGSYYCTCLNGLTAYQCTFQADDKGKTAGAVVGSVLGVALIAAVVVVLILFFRNRSKKSCEDSQHKLTASINHINPHSSQDSSQNQPTDTNNAYESLKAAELRSDENSIYTSMQ